MLLVVSPNYMDSSQTLLKSAKVLGWDVHFNDSFKVPEHLLNRAGAVIGDEMFCAIIAAQMNWNLITNEPNWVTKLPEEYVNRKFQEMTLLEARSLTEPKFIKAKNKLFSGKLYNTGKEIDHPDRFNDEIVIVSDALKITSEYRVFVKNRKVVSICCYYLKGNKQTSAEVNYPKNYINNNDPILEFMNKFLSDKRVQIADSVVIDLCRFKKDTYTILNDNPSYASGLYGCDPVASLDAIKTACALQ